MATTKICSLPDCGKKHYAKGWCNFHWQRWRRHGAPDWEPVRQLNCSVNGCGNAPYRNGLCNKHRLRARRHGDPTKTVRRTDHNNCGKKECPAAKKVWSHIHYLQNEQTYKTKSHEWRQRNEEKYRTRIATYLSRHDVQQMARIRMRMWVAKNPERKRQMDSEFNQKNRSLVTSYKAKYHATKLRAMPAWLTDEHHQQIRAVYAEARRLTEQTGTRHEVDHIVPLQGKIVSGLHVPWNLRVLTRDENNRRPRIYAGD